MNTTHAGWSDGQVKVFAAQIRKDVGDGWRWIVPDLRRALCDSKALSVVLIQERDSVAISAIRSLVERLYREMNCEP